ncbi:hypothetical protein WDW89_11410 [Deltaproteobacteria bacterium TL4]
MDTNKLDKVLNDIKRHQNWISHRMTMCAVIHQQAEDQWRSAPNEATKEYMINKMRFFAQMKEGFKYLSKLT